MARTTILVATFHRNHLLKWNLASLATQNLRDVQIAILDDSFRPDDECRALIDSFRESLQLRYIHTGQTKTNDYWRVPGFAFNIGAKQSADSEFIILCCAEMFHVNSTIEHILEPLCQAPHLMTIPIGKQDKNAKILHHLQNGGSINDVMFNGLGGRLLVKYPFLMGIHSKDFFEIGGYDEDFTGVGVEDRDLVERMQWKGSQYRQTPAKVIHLHHRRARQSTGLGSAEHNRLQYNRTIYARKKGIVVRNADREWGKL